MGITNGNRNKTRRNLGLGKGMGMNHLEWEGMVLKTTFPPISTLQPSLQCKHSDRSHLHLSKKYTDYTLKSAVQYNTRNKNATIHSINNLKSDSRIDSTYFRTADSRADAKLCQLPSVSQLLCLKTSHHFVYRVTRQVVHDFKWQINYIRATKYLLCCYQRLGKFNAIMFAKYHNRPLLTAIKFYTNNFIEYIYNEI